MPSSLDRRTFLLAAGSAAVATAALTPGASAGEPVFAHGVASGDPLPDGILLWTRVTTDADRVSVTWEIAHQPTFDRIVRSGRVFTGAERDHTVKIEVHGLRPRTAYYYRFRLNGTTSPTGRTKTAPDEDFDCGRLRFGVVSCADWSIGHFAAYRFLADRSDLDAIVHLGDYIYEDSTSENKIRAFDPPHEAVTLEDYRRRHAQYKTDPHLQRLHATHPFIVTWDDHESSENSWTGGSPTHDPTQDGNWSDRKIASTRAYFEWMPVREGHLFRRLRFGTLVDLTMLDLRSYRTQQPASGTVDPNGTILGAQQRDWLLRGLRESRARWKLIGNSVMVSPFKIPPFPGFPTSNPDQWDGYPADREAVLRTLQEDGERNAVFLTGDIHSSWANDVPIDADTYPVTPSVATELTVTSITSDNFDERLRVPPRTTSVLLEAKIMELNRHVRYVELDSHGASVLEVTPEMVQMDWYYLADRRDPDSTITYARSFRVRSGTARVEPTATPI